MRTLVVYDSVFGNTERIALAVRASLLSAGDATAVRAAEYKPGDLSGVDFLVVGSPTRAFSPTKAVTSFLKGLPEGALRGVKTAAFDTRIALKDVDSKFLNVMVKLFGYAAEPIARNLRKKGGELVAAPEAFYVKGSEGPSKGWRTRKSLGVAENGRTAPEDHSLKNPAR